MRICPFLLQINFFSLKHFGNTLRVAAGAAAGVASTDRLCHQLKRVRRSFLVVKYIRTESIAGSSVLSAAGGLPNEYTHTHKGL